MSALFRGAAIFYFRQALPQLNAIHTQLLPKSATAIVWPQLLLPLPVTIVQF